MQVISKHPVLFTVVPYLLLRTWQLAFLSLNPDVKRYFEAASAWVSGQIPYAQFQLEYPPGGLLLFWLPRRLTAGFTPYSVLFALEMLLFDAAIVVLLSKLPDALARGQSGPSRRYQGVRAVWSYLVFTAPLRTLEFERFDIACAFLFLFWLHQVATNERRWIPDLLMALGIWVKLVSVLFAPVYLAYLCAKDIGPSSSFKESRREILRWLLKEGIIRTSCVAVFTAALFLPFYLTAGNALFSFLEYHRARGLQIESTYASLVLFAHQYFGEPLRTAHVFGCTEIVHPVARALADASPALTVAGFLGISGLYVPRILASKEGDRDLLLLEAMLALLLAFAACSKVFSPQYLLWVAPLVPWLLLRQTRRARIQVSAFAAVTFLTASILLFLYKDLLLLQLMPTWLLLIRNLLVVALLVSLLAARRPGGVTASGEG